MSNWIQRVDALLIEASASVDAEFRRKANKEWGRVLGRVKGVSMDESKTYDDLPTVMQYLENMGGGKKRTRPARKALAEFWSGAGNDVPQRIIRGAEIAIDEVDSDMRAEWEDSGYSEDQIRNTAFETAQDIHRELYAGFFWLNLLEKSKSEPLWKHMPERF